MANSITKTITQAKSYSEWKAAALAFDERNGLERWKNCEKSNHYDYAAIQRRLEQMQVFREANDNQALLFTLNEGIHGNLGGMGSSALYQKAKFGTKQLVVDYIEEVESALTHLASPKVKGVTHQEKVDFFQRASLCFGRSALMMSGSGTFLFFHVGVLKALFEQNLLPEVISGASGGAFVAAILGTRAPEKISEMFTPRFTHVEFDLKSALNKFIPLLKKSANVSRHDLEEIVVKLLPDLTFAEAYNLSGLQINISITPAEEHQKSRPS